MSNILQNETLSAIIERQRQRNKQKIENILKICNSNFHTISSTSCQRKYFRAEVKYFQVVLNTFDNSVP